MNASSFALALALSLPALLVTAPAGAQAAVLEVSAEVSPSLAPFRALDATPGGLVWVRAADSPGLHRCRLVLRDGVLCRVTGFPRGARDLQLVIDAPGFQRTVRTAPRIGVHQNRLVVRLDPVHLRPAPVTAGPVSVSHSDSTLRLQLSVTNRTAESIDVGSITLEATRPGGPCMAEDPVVVYRLSAKLAVRERAAGRWAVATTATEPGRDAEHVRVAGEFTRDLCNGERLVLRLAPRMSVGGADRLEVDLVLPRRFVVEGADATGGRANAQGTGFDGSLEAFRLYVVSLQTSSPAARSVRTFVQP